jgi:GntR family transcriptional regulator / MocR family aminotransferase
MRVRGIDDITIRDRPMGVKYRRRRDLLVEELATLPEATVRGIAAGLHATVEVPDGYD